MDSPSSRSAPKKAIFRKPGLDDLETLAEIYNHAVRNTAGTFDTEEKQPGYFQNFVPGDGLRRMLVAEVDGKVVGYAGTYPFSQRKAYSQLAELMVYVHPEWQQQGIGRLLLEEMHKTEFFRELYTILVLINKENLHMQRLVEQLGYTYKGEMTDVALKFGRRHSLVIYQRDVVSGDMVRS